MNRCLMTRYTYNLPVALLQGLEKLKDTRNKPINELITRALVREYPELRSLPSEVVEFFLRPVRRDI